MRKFEEKMKFVANQYLLVFITFKILVKMFLCDPCPSPLFPEEGFVCAGSDLESLLSIVPDEWSVSSNLSYTAGAWNPMQYLKTIYPCCLHCVWSLGYPATDEIVVLYGAAYNCSAFEDDFSLFDADSNRRLSPSELVSFFDSQEELRNLILQNVLDPHLAFSQADLDRNAAVTLVCYAYHLRVIYTLRYCYHTGRVPSPPPLPRPPPALGRPALHPRKPVPPPHRTGAPGRPLSGPSPLPPPLLPILISIMIMTMITTGALSQDAPLVSRWVTLALAAARRAYAARGWPAAALVPPTAEQVPAARRRGGGAVRAAPESAGVRLRGARVIVCSWRRHLRAETWTGAAGVAGYIILPLL